MNNFMKEAINLAEENIVDNYGGPFGAVVVKDGQIIGKGSNHVLKNNDPTAHAEVMAIREACKNINSYDLSGCEIYTNCYPCPMCLSAIIWSNIRNVYYGNTKEDASIIGFRDDFIYDYIRNNDNSDVLNFVQLDRNETIKSFDKYDSKSDKTIY